MIPERERNTQFGAFRPQMFPSGNETVSGIRPSVTGIRPRQGCRIVLGAFPRHRGIQVAVRRFPLSGPKSSPTVENPLLTAF